MGDLGNTRGFSHGLREIQHAADGRVWQRQYVGAAAAPALPSSSQKTDRYRTIFYTTNWMTKSE